MREEGEAPWSKEGPAAAAGGGGRRGRGGRLAFGDARSARRPGSLLGEVVPGRLALLGELKHDAVLVRLHPGRALLDGELAVELLDLQPLPRLAIDRQVQLRRVELALHEAVHVVALEQALCDGHVDLHLPCRVRPRVVLQPHRPVLLRGYRVAGLNKYRRAAGDEARARNDLGVGGDLEAPAVREVVGVLALAVQILLQRRALPVVEFPRGPSVSLDVLRARLNLDPGGAELHPQPVAVVHAAGGERPVAVVRHLLPLEAPAGLPHEELELGLGGGQHDRPSPDRGVVLRADEPRAFGDVPRAEGLVGAADHDVPAGRAVEGTSISKDMAARGARARAHTARALLLPRWGGRPARAHARRGERAGRGRR
eukprot:CAMPEP_0176226052 /NCGR_PEP_ID=MMETSP0121_2-20121125/22068_1 /TAXON_ID=160619 /ORGANISM="Kryptoperidinium foliaceum, Strain CCMP 1326" /LENGTH=369 /DNA_ID=CAMNT_0017565319 /DNA_START=41 /DNA_END=1147 /DNA_ORIENTATION=-